MKKVLSILLILVLCMGLVAMTGCGKDDEGRQIPASAYDDLDLSEYVVLPDYSGYTTGTPNVTVTDADIEAAIEEKLEAAAKTEQVTEGKVQKGDTVLVTFKGELADGSSPDGMSGESYPVVLGSGSMIEGFEEGLYGATIGEEVTLDLQFPDPYEISEELSGKDVTFKVTVTAKAVQVVPELDEEFVKANSDVKTVEEYRALIAEEVKEAETESQLSNFKNDIYLEIMENTEVLKYPEDQIKVEGDAMTELYKSYASTYGYDWDEVLETMLQMTQEEYDEELRLYAEETVKSKMVAYALQKAEGVEFPMDEYEIALQSILSMSGAPDEASFEEAMGCTLEEYGESYNYNVGLRVTLVLSEALDSIYEKLEKK